LKSPRFCDSKTALISHAPPLNGYGSLHLWWNVALQPASQSAHSISARMLVMSGVELGSCISFPSGGHTYGFTGKDGQADRLAAHGPAFYARKGVIAGIRS